MSSSKPGLIRGFLNLSDSERDELLELIENYKERPYATKESLQKSLVESTTVTFGPSTGGCPYCGK